MSADEHRAVSNCTVIRPFVEEVGAITLESVAEAYPVMGIDSAEKLAAYVHDLSQSARDSEVHWVVAEDMNRELVGAMRLYDFRMNVRGIDALTGGVGSVAVALAHKRQGIARALIAWYLDYYRTRGAAFAVLHPFRLDFYRKLGFGYGTPTHRYRFAPETLRPEGASGTVRPLGAADLDAMISCSERVRAQTNGLIAKHRPATERALRDKKSRYIGVVVQETLRAFMQTSIALGEQGHTNNNSLIVRDLQAEDDASFAALLGYLHAQRDQFAAISIESQDEALFLVANDPRDGSDVVVKPPATHRISETGLGVMYRLLDIPRAMAHLSAVEAAFTLRVEVEDTFFMPTAGTWTFRFSKHEAPQIDEESEPDAMLRIGCADLASLIVGSLGLRSMVRHRLVALEPAEMIGTVATAFRVSAAPFCQTRF